MKPLLLLVPLALGLAAPVLLPGCKPSAATSSATTAAPKYHCPMHPTVVSDKPGTCPICSMDLVLIGKDSASEDTATKSGLADMATVAISSEKRQLLGLKLGTIEKFPLAREVRTSARIVADETRLWRVTTKVVGWVEQLQVAYTGQSVKKGDPLLTIYSPDLVSAQAEYLSALKAQESAKGDGESSVHSLLASARKRLELWDVTPEQIDRLTRTREVEKNLTLYAPASGVVLERNVLAGQKIMEGAPLMVIADLSVVWGDADIYQSDLPYVREQMPLELSLPYWPGEVFKGKVIFVSPTLDENSRTLRARLEIPNEEMRLKPGMLGNASLFYEVGEKLSIPASAVMFGAQRTYAFRDAGKGHLVPVPIKIGIRSDNRYELLSGLQEGDHVVVSANFLVDSESNLKAALEALAGSSRQYDANPPATEDSVAVEIPSAEYARGIPAYLELQRALVAADLDKAHASANRIATVALSAKLIVDSKTIDEARAHFKPLSEIFIHAAEKNGPGELEKLYVFQCPMADNDRGARWLQENSSTQNPYYGEMMLKCGENQSVIQAGMKTPAR